MAKSALVNANKKIAKAVVGGYKAVEDAVVGGYKTVERTVVGGYEAVEDAFVDRFLTEDGEIVADAKARLRRSQPHGAPADGRDAPPTAISPSIDSLSLYPSHLFKSRCPSSNP